MIATCTRPVCRLATAEDDLSILNIATGQYVNREQVFVAIMDGKVVGALVIWDGGHSVVKCDNFNVSSDYPTVGPQIILAFNEWCQQNHKTMMHYVTPSIELTYQAKRRGATVLGPLFGIIYHVTHLKGARHA